MFDHALPEKPPEITLEQRNELYRRVEELVKEMGIGQSASVGLVLPKEGQPDSWSIRIQPKQEWFYQDGTSIGWM